MDRRCEKLADMSQGASVVIWLANTGEIDFLAPVIGYQCPGDVLPCQMAAGSAPCTDSICCIWLYRVAEVRNRHKIQLQI